MKTFLQIEEQDNLIVALQTLESGTKVAVGGQSITLKERIPAKHKFALTDLALGDTAVMYGVIVGTVRQPIGQGELVSTENLEQDH